MAAPLPDHYGTAAACLKYPAITRVQSDALPLRILAHTLPRAAELLVLVEPGRIHHRRLTPNTCLPNLRFVGCHNGKEPFPLGNKPPPMSSKEELITRNLRLAPYCVRRFLSRYRIPGVLGLD